MAAIGSTPPRSFLLRFLAVRDHQSFVAQATPLAQDVAAAADPYEAGMAMMSYAMSCIAEAGCDCPHAFWLIWGCLTDGFDAP